MTVGCPNPGCESNSALIGGHVTTRYPIEELPRLPSAGLDSIKSEALPVRLLKVCRVRIQSGAPPPNANLSAQFNFKSSSSSQAYNGLPALEGPGLGASGAAQTNR